MQITIDTANITDLDKQVLAILSGNAAVNVPVAPKAAPAAKATPAPAKAAKAEPTPEPEDAEDEDVAEPGATLEDAVALATKLVSNGEAAKVKAALTTVGAKKVSEIPVAKVDEFIAALS